MDYILGEEILKTPVGASVPCRTPPSAQRSCPFAFPKDAADRPGLKTTVDRRYLGTSLQIRLFTLHTATFLPVDQGIRDCVLQKQQFLHSFSYLFFLSAHPCLQSLA